MSVVNVKVKFIRPQYDNLKEWCEDEDNVYIGRGRIVRIQGHRYPPTDSLFANPYKLKNCKSVDQCLSLYESHLLLKLRDPQIMKEFKKLKGKNLGCWCKPEKCHGDIILKHLENLN